MTKFYFKTIVPLFFVAPDSSQINLHSILSRFCLKTYKCIPKYEFSKQTIIDQVSKRMKVRLLACMPPLRNKILVGDCIYFHSVVTGYLHRLFETFRSKGRRSVQQLHTFFTISQSMQHCKISVLFFCRRCCWITIYIYQCNNDSALCHRQNH